MFPLLPLEEVPLGLARAEVERQFAPFTRVDDAAWERRFERRNRKVWRQYLRRRLLFWSAQRRRDRDAVREEYAAGRRGLGTESYRLDAAADARSLWRWGERRSFAASSGGTRLRVLLLAQAIALLKPQRVLEIGCGSGINLLLLAGGFPETAFTGLDLTPERIATAKQLQAQNTALPLHLQTFAPFPLADPTAFRRVTFQTGDAAALPYTDNSFDLVITVLALEQMQRILRPALRELARVAAGHAFMIEPFHEANATGIARRYVIAQDYLQARITTLPRHGLHPLWATADLPQEAFMRACAVLAKAA
ncbi:MAG TPA: class I SAM-dependent methyltransferase [Candidatus Cybelea sp.]|nr:class I SAM-dependent methyltransferase [Candidatus Cybelea sp.]